MRYPGNDRVESSMRMAELVIRDLEGEVKERLRRRARAHGRSLDEEMRDILHSAVAVRDPSPVGLGSHISAVFADAGLGEPISELRPREAAIPDFSAVVRVAKQRPTLAYGGRRSNVDRYKTQR